MSKKKKAGQILTDAQAAKKYYGSGKASEIAVPSEDMLWLPSRNLYLNYTMGGGIPFGRICEIFGNESSGKSLVAMDFAYAAQYLGGVILWSDSEQAFDAHWAEVNGLDLDRIILYNETAIESVSDWAADMAITWRNKLTNNEPILLIHDSLAAYDCEDNINSQQSEGKAEMGSRAKAIYRYVRTRNEFFSELGITSIFINQLRKKLGVTMFEDPDTTPGGEAMKFYAHQRMAFFRKKQITEGNKDNKIWLGNEVSVRMKKNKVAPPRSTFTTKIYFNHDYGRVGFEKYTNLVELLVKTKVVEKTGSRFYFKGEVLENGRDNFQNRLEEDDDLRRKLLRRSKVNTISVTQKRMEKLEKNGINRYPVVIRKSKSSDDE